jgi:hypothetical protein
LVIAWLIFLFIGSFFIIIANFHLSLDFKNNLRIINYRLKIFLWEWKHPFLPYLEKKNDPLDLMITSPSKKKISLHEAIQLFYSEEYKKKRDEERIKELKIIGLGLFLFARKNGSYPLRTKPVLLEKDKDLQQKIKSIIKYLPADPSYRYSYAYYGRSNFYLVVALLESSFYQNKYGPFHYVTNNQRLAQSSISIFDPNLFILD